MLISTSKFIIKSILKPLRRQRKKNSGFTLIELLVAMLLTFLIITPLMSLVISFMNNDRQEQAKNSSQQEIQAAVDYIAQDLQQAVYIYDAAGLSTGGIQSQIPPAGGEVKGCKNAASCVPVLAFWKRKYFDTKDRVKDPITDDLVDIKDTNVQNDGQFSDKFVYSLVVYYLLKNDAATPNSTWSQVNRIGRFEFNGGIPNPNTPPGQDPPNYILNPDQGFQLFDLSEVPGDIKGSMNSWTKIRPYKDSLEVVTLVDYIDNTPIADFTAAGINQFTPPENDLGLLSTECSNKSTGKDSSGNPSSSRVPPDITVPLANTGSFYACVNPVNSQEQSVVQVFLRGNALPRMSRNPATWQIGTGNQQAQLVNRPIANVRVAVRGLLKEPEE